MKTHSNDSLFVRITKITVKTVCYVVIFGVIGYLLIASFSTGNPAEMDALLVNDAIYNAYTALPEGEELNIFYHYTPDEKEKLITMVPNKNYSYFAVTDVKFIEEADEIQVVFRYGNSTIRHLVEDYKLDKTPDRTEELYDVTLYVAYDLTPENHKDNNGNDPAAVRFERYHATSVTAAEKFRYNYRKLTFDGIDTSDPEAPVLAVYVDIYYKGDLDYEAEPYGTLIIYDYATEPIPYDLTKADKKALEEYKG